MGYQEYLISSSKRNIEDCKNFLSDRLNKSHMNLEVICTTKANQEILANKVTLLGKTHDMDPITLKKGDEFVIISGEKPINSVKNLFPLLERRYVKAIPLENVMFSNGVDGKDY